MLRIDLATLFMTPSISDVSTLAADRYLSKRAMTELILDRFSPEASCIFVRVAASDRDPLCIQVEGGFQLRRVPAGGWLLMSDASDSSSYWFPCDIYQRSYDIQGHILTERAVSLTEMQISAERASATIITSSDDVIEGVVWQCAPDLTAELLNAKPDDLPPIFLWGSHSLYSHPADVYQHLIHGFVFENRYAWPHKRRICSENDAHALYVALCGLKRTSGLRIYGLLMEQILLSVLARQGQDGGFRHGEWTNKMESHYRLHCSAMHLMMDVLAEREDPTVRRALENAAAYIARQTDRTDFGQWFLHDELEHRIEAMNDGPFHWIPSRILGKCQSNMLVLNSHLDATVALDRYRERTGDDQYADLVTSACGAAGKILNLRSADLFYRLLFRAIGLTLLPAGVAKKLPLPIRALKRISWKYLIPRLPALKTRWPRLVMPSGYIDREISLKVWAYDYHSINVMDLLRFLRRFPDESLWRIAESAIHFGHESGLQQKCLESNGKEYSLGFWAEALYHACTLRSESKYRAWLADTMLMLDDRQIGLPPSLLGANAEAVSTEEQVPCPLPSDKRLWVANITRGNQVEILVVNPTNEPITLSFDPVLSTSLNWSHAGHAVREIDEEPPVISARGWMSGIVAKGSIGKMVRRGATCVSAS
jgi:hypothetical protein